MALHSEVRILLSYVHLHHLMAMETVNHGDIKVVTVSILKMARICSLTRRMDTSQSARLKFGKSHLLTDERDEITTALHSIVVIILNNL